MIASAPAPPSTMIAVTELEVPTVGSIVTWSAPLPVWTVTRVTPAFGQEIVLASRLQPSTTAVGVKVGTTAVSVSRRFAPETATVTWLFSPGFATKSSVVALVRPPERPLSEPNQRKRCQTPNRVKGEVCRDCYFLPPLFAAPDMRGRGSLRLG